MYNINCQSTPSACSIAALFLGISLLSGCHQSHQLGMEYNPQEILDKKLNDPQVVLTPSESITLLHHCTRLGEQSAAPATEKTVSIFAGNTGAGKSTSLNALLGCRMKVVRSRDIGLSGVRRQVVIVDPDSDIAEVMPIGHHSSQSQTFLPQIVQVPNSPENAYCDCPGFSDTRCPEINIANAINIRKVLQRANGVKAIFLTSYNGLLEDRGNSIKTMENMCQQMFGGGEIGINNLKRYQDSVRLGITKAPIFEDGEPITCDEVSELLIESRNKIAEILANRVFLFDPLDRGSDNRDFWSLEQCRNEIAQLESIPQQEAATLFQTAINDKDRTYLLDTARHLRAQITRSITQVDTTTLGQRWQLFQQLRIIEHPEIERLQGEVLSEINVAILKRAEGVTSSASVRNFDDAERKLDQLVSITNNLPGAPLVCDINDLRANLRFCKEKQRDEEAFRKQIASLTKEIEALKKREQDRRMDLLAVLGPLAPFIW